MRWLLACMIWVLSGPATAQALADPFCALSCRASVPLGPALGNDLAYDACVALLCRTDGPSGPAWDVGRMHDPNHGGYASVSSADMSEQLIVTCESRGPMSVLLRSGSMDRGEVQVIVDGQGVEWLTLDQRGGVLIAEIPRTSRLVMALQDGGQVSLLSTSGQMRSDFGLRGSDRAIRQAMGYCMER